MAVFQKGSVSPPTSFGLHPDDAGWKDHDPASGRLHGPGTRRG
jgi:hypothetical protein